MNDYLPMCRCLEMRTDGTLVAALTGGLSGLMHNQVLDFFRNGFFVWHGISVGADSGVCHCCLTPCLVIIGAGSLFSLGFCVLGSKQAFPLLSLVLEVAQSLSCSGRVPSSRHMGQRLLRSVPKAAPLGKQCPSLGNEGLLPSPSPPHLSCL